MSEVNSNNSRMWETLQWNKMHSRIFNIQKRIYRAAKRCDVQVMQKLQHHLLFSDDALILSIEFMSNHVQSYYYNHEQAKVIHKDEDKLKILNGLKKETKLKCDGFTEFIEKVKQYTIYLCLKPEWQAKSEPLTSEDSDKANYKLQAKVKQFATNTWFTKCDRLYCLSINHNLICKYIDKQYLLAKLQPITYIKNNINNWLDKQHFIESLSQGKKISRWLFPIKDYLIQLVEQVIYIGMEWCIYISEELVSLNNDYILTPRLFYQQNKLVYINQTYICQNVCEQLQFFFMAIGYCSKPVALSLRQIDDSSCKIFEFYVHTHLNICRYELQIELSRQIVKKLFYDIRTVLYHQSQRNKWRINNYLSLFTCSRLIYMNISTFYKYYRVVINKDFQDYTHKKTELILYHWYKKQSNSINKKKFEMIKNNLFIKLDRIDQDCVKMQMML